MWPPDGDSTLEGDNECGIKAAVANKHRVAVFTSELSIATISVIYLCLSLFCLLFYHRRVFKKASPNGKVGQS